jgi:deoxyribodipyrimidine photolyase-related protein
MSSHACIILPHQLIDKTPLPVSTHPTYLVEEHLFFTQYAFHKQKLAFHRATMSAYAKSLREKGVTLMYIEACELAHDLRELIPQLADKGIDTLHLIDPTDHYAKQRLHEGALKHGIELIWYDNPLFMNTPADNHTFFKPEKKKFYQTTFYKAERIKRNILIEADNQPTGGRWTFDTDNRKKYPKGRIPPRISSPSPSTFYTEATHYVTTHFPEAQGELTEQPIYPLTHAQALTWLDEFLKDRFAEFGLYEDAMVQHESILHHSLLSPLINVGLLHPKEVLDTLLEYATHHHIPINSTEGLVRQLIGWREFIRGVYEVKGTEERTRNFWNFNRPLPKSFYTGTTGIPPVDDTIKRVMETGYCHHIERLMILGNFMLLCEIDPDEVYRWFMELFIDAYDWVMVPNVYGMSQFADGGLMSTKPYISSSNYLLKMSNYPKGDWQEIWDGLFWRFMHTHRDFFLKNPRLSMLIRTFDKMAPEKQEAHLQRAEAYLAQLDTGC